MRVLGCVRRPLHALATVAGVGLGFVRLVIGFLREAYADDPAQPFN